MRWNSPIVAGAAFFVLAASAHAADVAVPYKAPRAVEAPAQVSGYVELYTGWARTRNTALGFADDSERGTGWPLGGAGRGTWWFSPNASLQLDVQGEGTSYRIGDDRFSTHSYLIGGHLNWRDSQRGLIGIFGGGGDAGGHGLTGNSVRHGLVGGEAQLYWNTVTLYVQGGYDSTIGGLDNVLYEGVHAWFVRGTGRWFVTPNFLLEATGLYADGEIENRPGIGAFNFASERGFQTWLWQAKAEWRPGATPFSLFAKYQGSETRWDDMFVLGTGTFTQRVADHRVLAGVRLYLAQGTLLSNDRSGTTLDIIDPLSVPTSPNMFGQTQGAFFSDRRLKRDIELVAHRGDGLGVYRYRYLWSDEVYVGVMAQEVAELYPSAVVRGADGYLRVRYAELGMEFLTLAQWNARNDAVH
jgi:hypothetical protein